jgi:hypothetical protein
MITSRKLRVLVPTLPTYGLALLFAACQKSPEPNYAGVLNGCKNQPILESKNLRKLDFTGKEMESTGEIDSKTSIGYEFSVRAGQTMSFSTNHLVCVRVFDPESKPLSELKFTKTGKYIMQISTPDGTKNPMSFNLFVTLSSGSTAKTSSAVPASPAATATARQPSSPQAARPSPVEFVEEHYRLLSAREYRMTWARLSEKFRQKSTSYRQWWSGVDSIQVGNIKVISQSATKAIVDAELSYRLKEGNKVKHDDKRWIHLRWNHLKNSWEIDDKTKPF